ncbi:MAG TPA: ABC transporter permease [Bryobacteraceae bacterium]|nr:ABC transporter permease [Bryobacteraceae bacterium]
MSVVYVEPKASVDASTRRAHAEALVRNESGETWRAADGFAIGCQIYEAESGALVEDGARRPPERDVAAGEAAPVRLDFEFPKEDGRYRAYLSPMREGVCWYHERDWPFLLIEAVVRGGEARLGRVRVVRQAELRRERARREMWLAFRDPVATIWRNRGLIRVMVRRDILGRYRGSFAGAFWTLIHPLLLMLTYFFVFGLVLRSHVEGDPSRAGFGLYFLAGMLPWLAVSEALGRAPTVILEHRNFVRKLVFAVETLPVNLVSSGLVSELFAVLLFGVFLLLLRGGLPAQALWLPALLVPQILLTLGLSWFLAALGAFVRDLGQVTGFLLTLWFFLTPICYAERSLASLPHSATLVLSKNPMLVLVRGYRAILLQHQAPAFGPLWKLWLLSAAIFFLGHAWFHKLQKSFADIL